MKQFWVDYLQIVKVLRHEIKRFVKYQIATKLLLMLIMLPLFKTVFNLALKSKGMSYLTNGLLQRFIVSPQGIFIVVFAMIFGFIVVMIELGGLIVLSHQVLLHEGESSYYNVALYAIKRMKPFFGLDGLLVLLYLFLMGPLLDNNMKSSLVTSLQIPGFVMDVVLNNNVLFTILVAGGILFILLSFRWMFALHVVLLGYSNEKHFLRKSGKLVFKNWKFILKHAVAITSINLLILAGLALVYILISAVILVLFAGFALEPIALILFSIGFIGFFGVYFILTPFQVLHTTQIYHRIVASEIKPLDLSADKSYHVFDKILSNKQLMINAFIVAIVVTAGFTSVMMLEMEDVNYHVDITAHRGSSLEAPENTLAALNNAVKNGATYAEIDVQETKDHELILLHDASFNRTANVSKVASELTLNEIKDLDVGSWFSDTYAHEPVPTLEEAMVFANGKIKLNIELKTYDSSDLLVEEVVRLIQKHDYYNKCVITSLDYQVLQNIEGLDPKIKTGLIMYVALGDLEQLNVDFYSVEELNVTEGFVERAHLLGREVHVWTINTEEDMERMMELGVDNIITDYEKKLSDMINKQLEPSIK
jgi:glycerophosphoryl diester phosphodiesterase